MVINDQREGDAENPVASSAASVSSEGNHRCNHDVNNRENVVRSSRRTMKCSALLLISVGIWMCAIVSDRLQLTGLGIVMGTRDLASRIKAITLTETAQSLAVSQGLTSVSLKPTLPLRPKRTRKVFSPNDTFAEEILNEIDQIPLSIIIRPSSAAAAAAKIGSDTERADEAGLGFIGLFCRVEDTARRQLLRQTNMPLAPLELTIKFTICLTHPPSNELQSEMDLYQDIYLLSCKENMNLGKSYDFFRSVSRDFPSFQYYAKADMDTYILYHNLAMALDAAPPCKFYAGRSNFDLYDQVQQTKYMSGAMYMLSKDLADMIQQCGKPCEDIGHTRGPEDVLIGKMLKLQRQERIQFGDFGRNHSALNAIDFDLHPQLVFTHFVKEEAEWWRVHNYFREAISVDSIRQGKKEDFWDGSDTSLWDPNCIED